MVQGPLVSLVVVTGACNGFDKVFVFYLWLASQFFFLMTDNWKVIVEQLLCIFSRKKTESREAKVFDISYTME